MAVQKRVSADDFAEMVQVASLCMHLVDTKQWDRLSDVFTEDAVYDGKATITQKVAEGVSGIAALWSSLKMGVHYSTDLIVVDVGDAGKTATTVSKWMSTPDNDKIRTGVYRDEWSKTAAGWRIRRRVNTITKPDPGM